MDKPVAVLSITYFLRRGDGDGGVPVWSQDVREAVPFTTGSAASYVDAR